MTEEAAQAAADTVTTADAGADISSAITQAATETPNTAEQGNENTETANVDTEVSGEAGGQKAEGASETKAEGEQQEAIVYEDFQMPEGFALEGDRLENAKSFFQEKGYSQEQAQESINKYAEMRSLETQAQQAHVEATIKGWKQDVVNDPEMGGAKFEQTAELAKRASHTLGSQPLRDLMESTGLGNHPEVVRFFAKVGGMIREDRLDLGQGSASGAQVPIEKRMYPDLK